MKKFLSLFMSMVMLISITAGLDLTANAEVLSGDCGADGSNVTYTLDTDTGVLTISGSGKMYDYSSSSNVPWYGNRSSVKTVTISSGVTSIGDRSFYYCSSLTSITIPNSVTSIGDWAFYKCSSLTSITIPNSVTSIGRYAFYDCNSLTSITIPNSVTTIDNNAFSGCSSLTSVIIGNSVTSIGNGAFANCRSLTSITIPDSVTSIGNQAFWYCSSLTSVTIGNSVTSIGYEAFYSCSSLTSITIPNSVTSISDSAFSGCSSLTSITVDSNNQYYSSQGDVLFNKDKTTLIRYPEGNARTSYEIPNSVTSVGNYAFYYCISLTSITIPDSVKSIGNYAFCVCSSLTNVTIPDSVTSIGFRAFSHCKSLTSITVDSNNQYYSSQDGVLFNNDKTTLIQYPTGNARTSYEIPNSVTSVGDYAFRVCNSLTSITIPDSVTSIGSFAFDGCSSLTSVTIPNSVTSISDFAFSDCSSLTSVTIGNSVTSIGDWAFDGCSSLTSVTIPNSVTSIGNFAFSGCSSLKCVFYKGSEDEWSKVSISSNDSIGSDNDELKNANIHYNSTDSDGYKPLEIVESSCNQGGYTVYKCSICGNSYNADNTAELGHSFTNYVSDNKATCTEDETKTAKCDRCDARDTITIVGTALGHSFTNYVSDNNATCTSDGTKTAKCDRCDARDTITSVGTAFGHNFNGGKSCVVCGAVNPNYVEPPTPTQPATTAPAQPTTQPQREVTAEKETTTKPASVKVGKTVYKSDKNGDYVSTKVKKPAVSKATNTKKSIKITWKKVDAVSGYEVEYSTDKKFKKDVKTATVKGNKAKNPSVTLKNLKSNKTYYVRIRTYKTTKVNGKSTKVYSSWSKVKSVKTK